MVRGSAESIRNGARRLERRLERFYYNTPLTRTRPPKLSLLFLPKTYFVPISFDDLPPCLLKFFSETLQGRSQPSYHGYHAPQAWPSCFHSPSMGSDMVICLPWVLVIPAPNFHKSTNLTSLTVHWEALKQAIHQDGLAALGRPRQVRDAASAKLLTLTCELYYPLDPPWIILCE